MMTPEEITAAAEQLTRRFLYADRQDNRNEAIALGQFLDWCGEVYIQSAPSRQDFYFMREEDRPVIMALMTAVVTQRNVDAGGLIRKVWNKSTENY